jgi:glycyl-tRNA synthetase beta subunit
MDDSTKSKKKKKKSDTSTSSTLQKILTMTNKFESQYLKPILLKLEKTESALKCLYANQKKIQNSLRKQKVSDYYTKIINLFFVIDEYFIK